jgi:hypothetical protein
MKKRNGPSDIHARCCCNVTQEIIRQVLTGGGPQSITSTSVRDFWWSDWNQDKLLLERFGFRLSFQFTNTLNSFIRSLSDRRKLGITETAALRRLTRPQLPRNIERAHREAIFSLCTLFRVFILREHYVHSSL